MAIIRDLKPIKTKLRNDSRCARLLRLFQQLPLYQIPVDELTAEIEAIHKTRSIRFLNSSSPRFIEDLVDASIRDQANRSRIAEISMQCYKAESTLKDALDPLKDYLLITYSSDLSFVRTKEERVRVVNMALHPFIRFVDRVHRVQNIANMVLADIDKGSWSLRLLVSAHQLHNAPERSI